MSWGLDKPYAVIFTSILIVYTVFAYAQLVQCIRNGQPFMSAAWILLASPAPLYLVAITIEDRSLKLSEFSIQSWSFLFGDIMVLPVMAAMLAKAWQHLPWQAGLQVWWQSRLWWVFCLVIGTSAGIVFHIMERTNYDPLAWNSPSKLIHDFCAYTVLAGGLLFGLIPALFASGDGARWYVLIAVICLLVWVGLVIADNTLHKLDGRNLHSMFNWYTFRTIPYP